ncbi:NfeD family protein [uncultured Celeribacter sp.]|uniref:NfeD family protein n=1 Tax=uncultured Celeribacter sp. TaxID=1303376 RepID=UPI00374A7598
MENVMLLQQWWVWAVAAIALMGLEVLAPGFIFLGFGVGAGIVALLLALGLFGSNIAVILLIFAVLSLMAWLAMRRVFGLRKGQVKVWDKDINDDV